LSPRRIPYAEKRAAGQRKAIHFLRRTLGLERDVYEEILQRVAGVRSSTDLDDAGRGAVLDELRRLAGENERERSYPGKPHNFASAAMPETITKIEAQLADMGLTWSYADSIAKRMFGIERCTWVRKQDQLAAIVAALHVEQEKRDLGAAVDGLVAELQMTEAELAQLTKNLPATWRRNRRCLKAVIETLRAQLLKEDRS
jgi:phage gp16-like protein